MTVPLIHQCHEEHLRTTRYPSCPHCDGPADPRLGFHLLCRELAARGFATPQLDARPTCECIPCRDAQAIK